MVEERNGIEVLKISRCGPREAQGQARLLDLGLHVARRGHLRRATSPTTAPARRSGSASATAGGSTSARTGCSRWRRCSTSPNPPPIFGFNDNWIFQSQTALDLLDRARRPGRPDEPAVGRRRADPRQLQLARHRRPLRRAAGARHAPALGADRRPLLRAAEPGRLRERATATLHPVARSTTTSSRTSPSPPPSATPTRSRSRSGTSPTTRGSGAGRPSPASTPRC